ncbi:9555_t:CDS:2 [Paraglomus brasilianum]|uniref:9555_t:CDS:1 n=1 Tax=Paraglomus brasilianum TaxID=144538 RepID=A0A9N8WDM0_9GLOM|nr:9555_t:CDS:2 [Paraglomus brasilianum]
MADISNSNETATERELNESVEMKPDGTDKTEGNDETSPSPQTLDSSLTDPLPSPDAPTATTPPPLSSQSVKETEQVSQPSVQSQELKQSVEQDSPGVSSTSSEVPPTVVADKPLPPIPQTQSLEPTSPATTYPPTQAHSSPQSPNLPSDIESSILDATQSSINSSAEPKSRKTPASPSEKAKKNFTSAFTAVRGFLVKSSNMVVEKINQKLEEMDEEMLKAMEEEELLKQVEKNQIPNGEIDGGAKEVQNGRIVTEEENPSSAVASGGLVKGDVNEDDYKKKREELLGPPTPTATSNKNNIKYATVPSSSKSAARASQQNSTRSVIAETADALNERGEKLGQLNDKLEDMSNSSNEFARLAKQLAEKEANRKWYQLF